MSDYVNKKNILAWLQSNFPVDSFKGNEVKFPCPICNHESFYFNIVKAIGFCHRATCHSKPRLEDLIDLVGSRPEEAGYVPSFEKQEKHIEKVIKLPETATKITENDEDYVNLLRVSRHLELKDIEKFNLHKDDNYIYIPVMEDGKLVQYVGRRVIYYPLQLAFSTEKRYKYGSGANISKYIFNWDEVKYWPFMGLVENTFNAIWLHDLYITTNFGSYLSSFQIDKIIKSRIKAVIIFWDQNTSSKSWNAAAALAERGVRSCRVILHKQPDQIYRISIEKSMKEAIDKAFKSATSAYPQTIYI